MDGAACEFSSKIVSVMKIIWVAGARPNFMKIAPIWRAMEAFNKIALPYAERFEPLLIHTGQHYDANMSGVFFSDLALPEPHYSLGVGGGSHGGQVARTLVAFEKLLEQERPAMVGVVGDVNSTCACALATAKAYVLSGGRTPKLIHVEAGLRSGDRLMPEEINRVVTDSLSDLFFTSEESGTFNLLNEGIPPDRVHFVGNVMVDSLFNALNKEGGKKLIRNLKIPKYSDSLRSFGLVTLHRPSNVDDFEMLQRIMKALNEISTIIDIYFPVHPRTREKLEQWGLMEGDIISFSANTNNSLHVLSPLGYDDFLSLMSRAAFIITDSGGIQEETTALGIPCLTLRENTERPVTVTIGTNSLLGRNPESILPEVEKILAGKGKTGTRPTLWDGHAADRIIEVLSSFMEQGK